MPRTARRRVACAAGLLAMLAGLPLGESLADTVIVSVGPGMTFTPAFPVIRAGDTLMFRNMGGIHNVVADDGSFRCAYGCDNDGQGGNGNASSGNWIVPVRFDEPGEYGYFCETHGSPGKGMWGRVRVTLFHDGFES